MRAAGPRARRHRGLARGGLSAARLDARRTCSAKRSTRPSPLGQPLDAAACGRSSPARTADPAVRGSVRSLAGVLTGARGSGPARDAVLPAARVVLAAPPARRVGGRRVRRRRGARASRRGPSGTIGVYGRFVLVASEGGVTFWTGNHPLATRRRRPRGQSASSSARSSSSAAHPGLTPEEHRSRSTTATPSRASARDPVWWVGLARAQGLLHGRADRPVLCATLDEVSRGVGRSRTCCCCRSRSAGAMRAVAESDAGRTALLSAWWRRASLVCLMFFPQERFRIPVIDPALIVCAAALPDAGRVASVTIERIARRRAHLQRARQPAACWRRDPEHAGLPPARRRRRVAGWHRRDRRRARRASIPGASKSCTAPGPRGLGRSYIDGLRHALDDRRADLICQMDADLSHDPEYLPALATPPQPTTTS